MADRPNRAEIAKNYWEKYPSFREEVQSHFELQEELHEEIVAVCAYYLDRVFGRDSIISVWGNGSGLECIDGEKTLEIKIGYKGDSRSWFLYEDKEEGTMEPDSSAGLDFGREEVLTKQGLGIALYVYLILCANKNHMIVDSLTRQEGAQNVWRRLKEVGLINSLCMTERGNQWTQSFDLSFLSPDAYEILPEMVKKFSFNTSASSFGTTQSNDLTSLFP